MYLFLVAFWGLPCGKLGRRDRGPDEGQSVGRNWMLSCFPIPPLFVLFLWEETPVPPSAPAFLLPFHLPSLPLYWWEKTPVPRKWTPPRLDISLISFPHWIWRGRGMGGRPGDSLVPELGKPQAGLNGQCSSVAVLMRLGGS